MELQKQLTVYANSPFAAEVNLYLGRCDFETIAFDKAKTEPQAVASNGAQFVEAEEKN